MMSLLTRRSRYPILTLFIWAFFVIVLARFFLSDGGRSHTFSLFGSEFSRGSGRNGEKYAPIYVDKLPKGAPLQLPKLQAAFPAETAERRAERQSRLAVVKQRFEKSWMSYKEFAYGADELGPLSGKPVATSFGGWGATLVDSLDALWIVGMKDEFEQAVEMTRHIDFNHTEAREINVFETAIRYMGGLIGAYDISGARYPLLLEKAVEIGDWIYRVFDTPNRMPITRWRQAETQQEASGAALLAELGSFTLEFTRLSQLTGDGRYYDAVYRVAHAMERAQTHTRLPGLWPIIIDATGSMRWDFHLFSLGGMADSAFEYLPKMTALLAGREPLFRTMYERAIDTARAHLFYRPMTPDMPDILFSGGAESAFRSITLEPQGQHLACFAGGMVLLGARLYDRPDEIDVGRRLTDGCVWAYDAMPSGIMPEVFHMVPCPNDDGSDPASGDSGSRTIKANECRWNKQAWLDAVLKMHTKTEATVSMSDAERAAHIVAEERLRPGFTRVDDPRYFLRPEAIESVFYAHRMTADSAYADTAWRMWQAIDKHTQTELAHAALKDVTVEGDGTAGPTPPKEDKMESFWLAETLKYFYLVFSEPEHVSLDRYVLNTEAHTFLRPGATWQESL